MARRSPPQRKRRTDEHRRADVAMRHVEPTVAKAGYVTVPRPSGGDYGLDLGVETFDAGGLLENELFWIQVKSVARPAWLVDGRSFALSVEKRDLVHWLRQLMPVVLTVYDASADVTYWSDVQQYFGRLAGFSLPAAGERVTILLPGEGVFDPAVVQRIAAVKNDTVRRLSGG